METGGEEADDQDSGWLEVKKKHRSSSKFSTSQFGQPHIRRKGEILEKRPSRLFEGRGIVCADKADRIMKSNPLSNDSKSCCNADIVAEEDNAFQSLVSTFNCNDSEVQELPQKSMPQVAHKIKWGDLEDDLLEQYNEDIRPNKKFGHSKELNEVSSEHLDVPMINDIMITVNNNISDCMQTGSELIELNISREDDPLVKSRSFEPSGSFDGSSRAESVQNDKESGDHEIFNGRESVEDSGVQQAPEAHNFVAQIEVINPLGECDTIESKERFRQRLWCFLFENLNRAVDELYLLCELECDLEQMKEASVVLDEAGSDFQELIIRVKEFEKVKRTTVQSIDGVPITMKPDHRRPHALSWEVRRMTSSPHKAEILSSSLEAFKKIQQERAGISITNDAKPLRLACSRGYQTSSDLLKVTDACHEHPNISGLVTVSNKNSAGSHATQGKLTGARFPESGKYTRDPVQTPHSSNSKLTGLPPDKNGASYGIRKSKREHIISEKEKLLIKKDKVVVEDASDRNLKSIDNPRSQIFFPEKDKGRISQMAWKSLDAWKDKRNWEDILSSPLRSSSRLSHLPGMGRRSSDKTRILHDKLMSPEKKKKNALDLKKEAEERHARAMKIRSELENERVQKLQRTSEKLNRVNEWQAVRSMKLRQGMHARHQRGESRHEAYLAQVVRRAGDESSKVNEVRFITSLNGESKKFMLRQKLHDSEMRRAEKFNVMKTKQREDVAREEAVLERKKLIEAEKLQRIAETQRKKEEAQFRREEERKASSAAREARTIEQIRRKEERARMLLEESELLAQKLAEKLSESEQRRKFYLEQIRERASMDFRDQSSPLLRRYSNKEGQGRSAPTNNGDDYQGHGYAGLENSSLSTGSVTLQHPMKRRIKRIRQRLMALKYDYFDTGAENAGIGYRTSFSAARTKIGKWLQELQRLRQARKEGAASIGLITTEMVKYLDGKDPELQASRQAGLIDFIASSLPASHTSRPEGFQVTIHLLKLLRVVLSTDANRSYFLAQNLLPPIIPMLSAALENYIKIAASLSTPGSTSFPLGKASVENFESISEVLDGFLWTVSIIIDHVRSDGRQLVMRENLVELVIAYQVIHRLRDLFALYDRPQVEGSPFPSSILLGIYLLVVLSSSRGANSPINWDYLPTVAVLQNQSPDSKFGRFAGTEGCSTLKSITTDGVVECGSDALAGKPCCEPTETNESVVASKDAEKNLTGHSLDLNNIFDKACVLEESQKTLLDNSGSKQTNSNSLTLKQPAAFLLSIVSETGLVSLLSLLTAVLLQANSKSSEQASYTLPSNFEEVAIGVLKVLNNLALLDIAFLQRMLGRTDLKMEFFHLMSFLLSYCTSKWKVATDQVGLLLLESLSLLGHFALFHPENQAVLRWGKSPTILHKVCDLPFVFFSDPEFMPVLASTLVAACYGCEQNKGVVQQELSVDMLLSLLRSCRYFLQSNPTPESNNSGESRKSCTRNNTRNSNKNPAGKSGSTVRSGKMRNQKESISAAKSSSNEIIGLYNIGISETCTMLHSRFSSNFIDSAEQFFSVEITDLGYLI